MYNSRVRWAKWYYVEKSQTINEPDINVTNDAPHEIFVMYTEKEINA